MNSAYSLFSCFLFICHISLIVSALEPQTKFKRPLQDHDEETLNALITDSESETGRTDVQTTLNLSPWELFVLNDLVFKLTLKQCPMMDQDVVTSLKELISKSFKQVPVVQIQNGQFLPSYSRLVRCLEYFEESTKDENMKQQKLEIDLPDTQSKEIDWEAKDAIITSTTTNNPIQQEDEIQLASTWLWGFKSLHHLVVNYFESDESNEVLTAEERQHKQAANFKARKHQRHMVKTAYINARQNFADLFHKMSKVIRKTCPIIHRPDKLFMRNALMDIATWATTEQTDTITSATLYFKKHELLKQVEQCFTNL